MSFERGLLCLLSHPKICSELNCNRWLSSMRRISSNVILRLLLAEHFSLRDHLMKLLNRVSLSPVLSSSSGDRVDRCTPRVTAIAAINFLYLLKRTTGIFETLPIQIRGV